MEAKKAEQCLASQQGNVHMDEVVGCIHNVSLVTNVKYFNY